VGRVDRVELDGNLANITFRVPKSHVLYDDTDLSPTLYELTVVERGEPVFRCRCSEIRHPFVRIRLIAIKLPQER